jgi:DNA gyrase/topoisomerase IV subunit A
VDPQEVQSLEDLREAFRKQALAQQAPLLEELERLRAENARLREKIADKEALIKSEQKLIRRYEKELSEHAK